MASNFYHTYVVPAAVFQGVIIGGGYGTGREVVEYVSRHGALGGLLSIAVIALGFGLVLATSFAFAERFALTDYRHFLRALLGRAWVVYEILFVMLLVLVLAIVGSAAGTTAEQGFGLPHAGGVSIVLIVVVALNFFGRRLVEQALALWTALLMLALFAFFWVLLARAATPMFASLRGPINAGPALLSGAQFAVYNSALVPVLIYCAAGIEGTRSALRAGFVAGLFGALPALLLHLTFMTHLDAIVVQAIPTYWLLQQLAMPAAINLYYVVLFGTIVLTAAGVLHGLNERLDGWRRDNGRPALAPALHAVIAGIIVTLSLLLAEAGIVALVARGYGALSWAFFGVFTLPLLTIGMAKIRTTRSSTT